MAPPSTLYQRVGGDAYFEALTSRFYAAVREDPVLAPIYPADEADFEQARRHLCGFLVQFWGGPTTYSDERGHPRLRMRHAPFAVGQAERDAWVRHMVDAVRSSGAGSMEEAQMVSYFESAATQMINTPGAPDAAG
jgi:hemoglobin